MNWWRRLRGRDRLERELDDELRFHFDIADTGSMRGFRHGVRAGLIAVAVAPIAVLLPLHIVRWGLDLACAHAVNGVAIGWLLVELALSDVERPLVTSIPPSDGINTVGVVLLGTAVLATFAVAHIEEVTMASTAGRMLYPLAFVVLALWIRLRSQRTEIEGETAPASAVPAE